MCSRSAMGETWKQGKQVKFKTQSFYFSISQTNSQVNPSLGTVYGGVAFFLQIFDS